MIAIPSSGRKAISRALGDLYYDLVVISADEENLTDDEADTINEYMSSFVNGVTIKLATRLKKLFSDNAYDPIVDLDNLVRPSEVFSSVDFLMLTWRDGWELVPKKDFDRRLRYYRYSGGLVKLALVVGR